MYSWEVIKFNGLIFATAATLLLGVGCNEGGDAIEIVVEEAVPGEWGSPIDGLRCRVKDVSTSNHGEHELDPGIYLVNYDMTVQIENNALSDRKVHLKQSTDLVPPNIQIYFFYESEWRASDGLGVSQIEKAVHHLESKDHISFQVSADTIVNGNSVPTKIKFSILNYIYGDKNEAIESGEYELAREPNN